jgi:hypothetical protein
VFADLCGVGRNRCIQYLFNYKGFIEVLKMKNGKFCIAIMSVGSGVGQSVITSCNLSNLPIYKIGFGMNPFAFGACDCDEMDYVPTIYDGNYIDVLLDKCREHYVDLIIPGSDDEALILTENLERIEEN